LDGSLLLVVGDIFDPNSGPDQSGDFRVSPTFFVALLAIGFVVGALGHLVKSLVLVAVGVFLVFGATVLLPIAYALSN
jgi:hypothetical protein